MLDAPSVWKATGICRKKQSPKRSNVKKRICQIFVMRARTARRVDCKTAECSFDCKFLANERRRVRTTADEYIVCRAMKQRKSAKSFVKRGTSAQKWSGSRSLSGIIFVRLLRHRTNGNCSRNSPAARNQENRIIAHTIPVPACRRCPTFPKPK